MFGIVLSLILLSLLMGSYGQIWEITGSSFYCKAFSYFLITSWIIGISPNNYLSRMVEELSNPLLYPCKAFILLRRDSLSNNAFMVVFSFSFSNYKRLASSFATSFLNTSSSSMSSFCPMLVSLESMVIMSRSIKFFSTNGMKFDCESLC